MFKSCSLFPLALVCAVAATAAPEKMHLRVGVGENARPLSFIDTNKQLSGFTPALLQEVAREENLELEIVASNWTYILQEFRAGRIDVLANVAVDQERLGYMDFSISHAYVHASVAYRSDHAPIKNTADFAGKTIGALTGGLPYNDAAAHHGWGATLRGFPTFEATLDAVRKGDCDAALFLAHLSGPVPNDRGLRSGFVGDLIYRLHFAVHKGDTATLARLNEALAIVRQSGTFDRLWEKWLGPTEPHPIRLVDLGPYFLPLSLGLLVVLALFVWQRRMLNQMARQDKALRESENRFRSTFDNAGVGMALVDLRGRPTRSNPIFQRMIGYTEEEIGRMTFGEFTHPDDLKADLKLYEELMSGKRDSYQMEKRYIRKDGQVIWGHLTVSVVKNAEGQPLHAVGMVEDVTDKKQIEDALRQSQQSLQAILDHSPALIYVKNLDGRYLLTNRLFNEKFKRTAETLKGMTIRDIVAPAEAEMRTAHDRLVVERGAPISMEEQSEEEGGPRTYLAVKFPLRDAQGKIYAIGGVDTDITEYKALQVQFAQAQKMDAFGQLAGGIAHDFNNMLAVLMMQLNLLATRADLPADMGAKFRNLEEITLRAARLTRQLLMFSRREAVSIQDVDLNQVLTNVLKMLDRVLGEHIDLVFNHRRGPMWINADTGMMEQVIMNLCVNARDAMAGGGRLTIDTKIVEFGPTTSGENRRPGQFACLSVCDTGHGMDEGTLKRIFEPFFTTKEVGKGTGLGLATVYGIVKQHNGWVEVESTVGKGSTFYVYLPALDQSKSPQADAAVPEIQGGPERILIVEDDVAVREISALCLQQVGYDVVVAENAIQGLKIWEEQGYRFDLLLTDMVMPGGMSGLQLAKQLKQTKHTLKVIFMSGYSAEAASSRTPFGDIGKYIAKPIDRKMLLSTVRQCLNEN